MRYSVILPVVCGLLVTDAHAAGHPPVSYTESSVGLSSPGMEGGRTELEFGDVNGDGHVDLVSIGDHGSPFIGTGQHGVMVWYGNGTGTWSVFQNGDFGYGGVALGDVNGDGLMDVGYGMHHDYSGTDFGDQLLEVALGDGTGMNWTPWDDGLATNGETWGMFGTDFADVDNDGDLDVGSISFGCCAGIHVYLNNGDGTWTQSFGFIGGNSSQDFAFGDVNGDGLADFAAAHGNGTVYIGDGAGGFALADGNLPGSAWRRGTALGDVNGDGRDDLSFDTSSGIGVWTWVGPGTWADLSGSLATAGDFSLTKVADMNLDGHGDVVALSDERIVVYGGDGAGGWSTLATVVTPPGCGTAALQVGGDVDHNGFPDIARVTEENCVIIVGGTNRLRCYKESSTPTTPSVHPRYPRGGETFIAGSVRFVDWTAAVPVAEGGAQPTMSVEFSRTGPGGPWTSMATDVPNNGRHQWLVPANVLMSANCYLRYTLGTDPPTVAVTPEPFTIVSTSEQVFGDADGDGDVDLDDFAAFEMCFTGAGDTGTPDCVAAFDSDVDGDVDFVDFAALQLAFTGSMGG